MDGRPGDVVLIDRARSFGRDTHGTVREEGDTRLASQISRINPSDQWGDRCRSQIALTSKQKEEQRLRHIPSDSNTVFYRGAEHGRYDFLKFGTMVTLTLLT
ncbi:hypothetical protein L3Q82_011790 [Xyrichtys novacula]|uniref:Uncharacterized protein n=1 Tax=Xyrichtys novacula TaxID=13765 RepID=A0AAV1G2L3_XYRNO|nr:hypothetical protein L3Q82_011790 [Xyrichtys novacula]